MRRKVGHWIKEMDGRDGSAEKIDRGGSEVNEGHWILGG